MCVAERESTSMVLWTIGDHMARRADHWAGFWWMTGDRVVENTDIVTAINYVAGGDRARISFDTVDDLNYVTQANYEVKMEDKVTKSPMERKLASMRMQSPGVRIL